MRAPRRGGQADNRTALIDHLWDGWNRAHPPARQVRDLQLYYVLETTLPAGRTAPPEFLLLGLRSAAARPAAVPDPSHLGLGPD